MSPVKLFQQPSCWLRNSSLFRSFLILTFLACWDSLLHAQETGAVSGLVISSWDATSLPGVTVTVRGTTLATQTDLTGRYELKGVPSGTQILRFSKSGYASATVAEVRVIAGQTTVVDGNLRPEFFEMEEYEVTAEEFTEQTEKILFERQQSSSMLEAIGSDMFKNLAVGDAAQALGKLTGASVRDGKYAVIRGLADRYTFTTLNGLELPSADPDRKAFQLDLMPSKFIERMDVYKTFTPDMSGGFAGGSIDIVTKSYPEDFLFELRASTAYNTQSSLRDDFPVSDRGSKDWLAMDDGMRAMPEEIAAQSPSGGRNYPEEVKSSFKSTQFSSLRSDAPLDSGVDLLFGDTHDKFGKPLGFLVGFNHKNEYRMFEDWEVRSYDQGGSVTNVNKTVTSGEFEAQWGVLANLSLELNKGQNLSFNFLRIQSAKDEALRATGQDVEATDPEAGTYVDQSVLSWTERSLSYYQLAGAHEFFELNDVKFNWGAAVSSTTQDQPDYRVFQFLAEPDVPNFNADLPIAQPNFPARFWRNLEENNHSLRGDFTIPIPSYNEQENFIKTGGAVNRSRRDYFQRGIFLRSRNHPFETIGDPNIWMAQTNLPFVNIRNVPANLTYHGEQTVTAGYLMADWAVFNWLHLTGGARYESTELSIDTFNLTQDVELPPGLIEQEDWLPSLGIKFLIRTNLDVQASWSRTVVRPTYREIGAVPVYDVPQGRVIFGNPNLQMSASENFDLRASWYPRPGELFSLAGFVKRIDQPIELSSVVRDNSQIRYENFEGAEVQGVEGEMRLRLNRIWDPLEDFLFGIMRPISPLKCH